MHRETGTRRRMELEARRIFVQHRKLDELYDAVLEALLAGPKPAAELALLRFQDALDAHFSLEDELYFPALHGLQQNLGEQLDRLSAEHERLRTKLGHLAVVFHTRSREACMDLLEELADAIRSHEAREEELIAQFRKAQSGGGRASSRSRAGPCRR